MLRNLSDRLGPVKESPISSVSGAAFLIKYKAALLRESNLTSVNKTINSVVVPTDENVLLKSEIESLTYSSAKKRSKDYQSTKMTLYSFFSSPRNLNGQGGMNQIWISRRH